MRVDVADNAVDVVVVEVGQFHGNTIRVVQCLGARLQVLKPNGDWHFK